MCKKTASEIKADLKTVKSESASKESIVDLKEKISEINASQKEMNKMIYSIYQKVKEWDFLR